jgi:dTDP-4-dehydrorhamnose reductase
MAVLLLGRRGLLGSEIEAFAPAGTELHACSSQDLDVRDPDAVSDLLRRVRPAWVINATGYGAVDAAEADREAASALNYTAVEALGRVCAGLGARVVHFSTDYVFDGEATRPYTEEDPANPLSVYGATKWEGEAALLRSNARALVLRTSWLFGPGGPSFPRRMWERAKAGVETRVVDDQTGSPTYTRHLALATWSLIARELAGVYHVANAGHASWYEVARRIFEAAGAEELLTPCRTADDPCLAQRPAYSVLSTEKVRRDAGVTLPHWTDPLDEFARMLRTSG